MFYPATAFSNDLLAISLYTVEFARARLTFITLVTEVISARAADVLPQAPRPREGNTFPGLKRYLLRPSIICDEFIILQPLLKNRCLLPA